MTLLLAKNGRGDEQDRCHSEILRGLRMIASGIGMIVAAYARLYQLELTAKSGPETGIKI